MATLIGELAETNGNPTTLGCQVEELGSAGVEMSNTLKAETAHEIETLHRMIEHMDENDAACGGIEHWREDMLKRLDALYARKF